VGNKVFAIVFTFPTTLFYLLNLLFVKSNDACKNSLILDLFPDLDGLASANCDVGWAEVAEERTEMDAAITKEPAGKDAVAKE
jgi:hypothetical protein